MQLSDMWHDGQCRVCVELVWASSWLEWSTFCPPRVWLSREARPGGNCVCCGQGFYSSWGWRVANTQSLLVLVLWGHGGEIQHLLKLTRVFEMVLWGREGPDSGWADHCVLRSQGVFKKSWWFLSFAAKTSGGLESFFTHQGFWCLLGWVCVCVCVYCMHLGEYVPVWFCRVLPTKLACQGLLPLRSVVRRAHSNSHPARSWFSVKTVDAKYSYILVP